MQSKRINRNFTYSPELKLQAVKLLKSQRLLYKSSRIFCNLKKL